MKMFITHIYRLSQLGQKEYNEPPITHKQEQNTQTLVQQKELWRSLWSRKSGRLGREVEREQNPGGGGTYKEKAPSSVGQY